MKNLVDESNAAGYTEIPWNSISKSFSSRSAKDCAQHYGWKKKKVNRALSLQNASASASSVDQPGVDVANAPFGNSSLPQQSIMAHNTEIINGSSFESALSMESSLTESDSREGHFQFASFAPEVHAPAKVFSIHLDSNSGFYADSATSALSQAINASFSVNQGTSLQSLKILFLQAIPKTEANMQITSTMSPENILLFYNCERDGCRYLVLNDLDLEELEERTVLHVLKKNT